MIQIWTTFRKLEKWQETLDHHVLDFNHDSFDMTRVQKLIDIADKQCVVALAEDLILY